MRHSIRTLWLVCLALVVPSTSTTTVARSSHTGIAGQSFLPPQIFCFDVPPSGCPDPVPFPTTIAVLSETGEFVTKIATDDEGNFAVRLKPGVYWLMPEIFTQYIPPGSPLVFGVCVYYASPFQVTVEKKAVSSVEVRYEHYCVD